jgi:GTP cyclohydrolase II
MISALMLAVKLGRSRLECAVISPRPLRRHNPLKPSYAASKKAVYQLQEGRGIGIINKIRAYALQDEGADTVEANERLGLAVDLREYRQCAEVLFDLGLRRVRVMSNNPEKIRAFEQAGMEPVERVAL